MSKIVFVMQDRAIGGGTSSLSSLYNNIKEDYDIEIFQLTKYGSAKVSYSNVIKTSSWFCDSYYCSFADHKRFRSIITLIVKVLAKIFPSIINIYVRTFEKSYAGAKCVIAFGEGAAADFVGRIRTLKKFTWIHYDISYYPPNNRDLQLYLKFDKIVCVSHKIADSMRKMYPSLQERIVGIHNLVDHKRVYELSSVPVPIEDEYMFDTPFTIVSIGRLCMVKRFSAIPKIAKELKDANIKFRWIIIGPPSDSIEQQRLYDSLSKFDVEDCVVWIGPKENPYPYLARANMLVSTSSTEACPMIFIESKILNVPIVSTDILTADEFILDGVDGVIVPLNQMSKMIINLLTNPNKLSILKNNAFESAYNMTSIEAFRKLI